MITQQLLTSIGPIIMTVALGLVVFGVIRYVINSKAARSQKVAVNWDVFDSLSVTVGLYFLSQLFAALVVIAYGQFIAGRGGEQIYNELSESSLAQFLILLLVQVFIALALTYLLRLRKRSLKTIGLVRPKWRVLGYVVIGFLIYMPATVAVMVLAGILFPGIDFEQQQQIGFDTATSFQQLVLVFLSLVIITPFVEELLVRGFLYSGLKAKLRKFWAIIVTSLLFAVAHLQFGGGEGLLWPAAIDTFVLSLILIYIRDAAKSLWAPIGLHVIKNGVAFTALFIL